MGAYLVLTGSGAADDIAPLEAWRTAAEAWHGADLGEGGTYGDIEQRPDGAFIYRLPLTVNIMGCFAADFVPLPLGPNCVVAWIPPGTAEWIPPGPPEG